MSLWISWSFSEYHEQPLVSARQRYYKRSRGSNTFAVFHVVIDASWTLERASRNWLDCFDPNSGISTKLRAAVKWCVAYEIVLLIGAQDACIRICIRLFSLTSRILYFSLCNYLNTKIIGSAISSLMFMLCRIRHSWSIF